MRHLRFRHKHLPTIHSIWWLFEVTKYRPNLCQDAGHLETPPLANNFQLMSYQSDWPIQHPAILIAPEHSNWTWNVGFHSSDKIPNNWRTCCKTKRKTVRKLVFHLRTQILANGDNQMMVFGLFRRQTKRSFKTLLHTTATKHGSQVLGKMMFVLWGGRVTNLRLRLLLAKLHNVEESGANMKWGKTYHVERQSKCHSHAKALAINSHWRFRHQLESNWQIWQLLKSCLFPHSTSIVVSATR